MDREKAAAELGDRVQRGEQLPSRNTQGAAAKSGDRGEDSWRVNGQKGGQLSSQDVKGTEPANREDRGVGICQVRGQKGQWDRQPPGGARGGATSESGTEERAAGETGCTGSTRSVERTEMRAVTNSRHHKLLAARHAGHSRHRKIHCRNISQSLWGIYSLTSQSIAHNQYCN